MPVVHGPRIAINERFVLCSRSLAALFEGSKIMTNHLVSSVCLAASLSAFGSLLMGPVQGEEKKEPPVVKTIVPLGIADGMTVPLLIRGFKLTEITDLKFPELKTAPVFKIKSKGAAAAASMAPVEKVGDTQVEFDVTLPIDTPAGMTTFIVLGPNGQSEPRKLMILDSGKSVAEKEPNDGFSEAQEFTLGQTIIGNLAPKQNSDVFRFNGQKGQLVKIEAIARQLGSPLVPFLMLHDSNGRLLAEVDHDAAEGDPVLEFTLTKDDRYFITIQDAHDVSSPVHAYLLKTQAQ